MNSPSSPTLDWSETFLIGHTAIDHQHQKFVVLLAGVRSGCDSALCERLEALEAHARTHFQDEDRLMENTGFPQRKCHMDEHRAVLASVGEVLELVRVGDCREGRRLADALADWLPGHIQHMDSALAAWESTRTGGGKPVVLRRNVRNDLPGPVTPAETGVSLVEAA